MNVTNLQTLALGIAQQRATREVGLECDSMRKHGSSQAHFLSLPWPALTERYPYRTQPEIAFAGKNPATAQAVQRSGRSASHAIVDPRSKLAMHASTNV